MRRSVHSITKGNTPIPFDEFSRNLASFFERVVHGHETVMVEKEEGEVVVLQPLYAAKKRQARKKGAKDAKADHEAFLSSAGSWSDVDTDRLVENIYESRSISTRPPIKL